MKAGLIGVGALPGQREGDMRLCQGMAIRKRRQGTESNRLGITWKRVLNFTKNE